jgi:hypothetical protein
MAVRHIVSHIVPEPKEYYLNDLSPERLAASYSVLSKELKGRNISEADLSSIERLIQGASDPVDDATPWLFLSITSQLFRGEDTAGPDLPTTALEGLRATWYGCHESKYMNLIELCKYSTSRWDEYTRSLTPHLPAMLGDRAVAFADELDFDCVWAFIRTGLTQQQREHLLAWYQDTAKALTDSPMQLPNV